MKKYFILILLFFYQVIFFPKEINYKGEEIYNPYGNSNCSIQDNIGFIWCGTNEGIYRFDGFSFVSVYSGDPITSISADDKGNIYGGTIDGEIIIYSGTTGQIKNYKLKPDPLFIYSNRDYYKLPFKFSYYKSTTITSILVRKSHLFLGTWGSGIFIFDLLNNSQKEHLFYLKDENSLPGNFITSIINSGDSVSGVTITCGSFDAGLIKIDLNRKFYNSYYPDYQFTSICSDGKVLWGGTMQGLIKADTVSKDPFIVLNKPISHLYFKEYLFAAAIDNGIVKLNKNGKVEENIFDSLNQNNNSLQSLLIDKTGVLWGSTYAGIGLMKWTVSKNFFSSYKIQSSTSFAESTSGDLYIAASPGKLYKFSGKSNSFSLSENNLPEIKAVLFSSDGTLYISAGDKLLKYDEKYKKYYTVLSGVNIISLAYTSEGSIWCGSYSEGIIKISSDRGIAKPVFYKKSNIYPGSIPDNYIKKLFVSGNKLWGYSREGFLFAYNKENDEFEYWKLKDTRINIVSSFSKDGDIYIGAFGEGLFKFSKKEHKFYTVSYNSQSDFKNISGILQDENDNLWIAAESALLKYNTKQHQLFYFTEKNGISEKYFNPGVQFRTSSGKFIFGGINSLIMFLPSEEVRANYRPEIAVTSFKVMNEERQIPEIPLELESNENSVSFQFGCLDYNHPQQNQYKWKLEGFDTSFNFSYGAMRTANYKQLSPGEYRLRFIGANSFGVWSEKEIVIPFIIISPYYKTWWFFCIIILLLTTLPGYFILLKIQQRKTINEIKTKLSADLHDDIGSGLTEISLIAELLKNKSNSSDEYNLTQLGFISQRAREIVNSMSDIVWLVNPKEISFADLIIRLKNKVLPIAELLGINFSFDINENAENTLLAMDKKQNIYLIIKEAVNNSIKYSEGTIIKVQANIEKSKYEIKITDNGKGFDVSKEETGNGIRNMKKRGKDIKGEFFIKSNENGNSGTTVILRGNL